MFKLINPNIIVKMFVSSIAYIISVTTIGAIQAKVTAWMGDKTAEKMGYAEFNPLIHTDPFGLIILLFYGLGWYKTIPINYHNIYKDNFILRLLFVYILPLLVALAFSLSGFIILAIILDSYALGYAVNTFFKLGFLPIGDSTLQNYSSASILLISFLLSFTLINLLISVTSLFGNGFRFISNILDYYGYSLREYNYILNYILLLGPIFFIMFLTGPLLNYFSRFIFISAIFIRSIIGLLI